MTQYNGFEMLEIMEAARRIVFRSRQWHRREQAETDFEYHAAVRAAIAVCRPAQWQLLLLEWPHIADDDRTQIAYTRDERKGEENRQTMTSIGKYLKRHFPTMSDHVLRDIVALHKPNNVVFKFLHTNAEFAHAVDNGPTSCMCARYHGSADYWTDPQSHTEGNHPYNIYDPALGWHMAIVVEGDDITGRAMCIGKTFVRSYKGSRDVSGSSTDERLDAWLIDQGYSKQRNWEHGTLFKHIPLQHRHFVAPYLDGGHYYVVIAGDKLELVDYADLDNGDDYYECRSTQGVPTKETVNTNTVICEDCEESTDEDDACTVGMYEDRTVCSCCRDNNWTWAYTYRGRERYIPSDDVVYVNDNYYDTNYLSDNNIVHLEDGDYAHQDDAVYIERLDEWHIADDCRYCEHSNEYELERDVTQLHDGEWAHDDDCWQCEHSGESYLNEVDNMMTECGKLIHPAYAEHYTTETEGE